MKLIKAFLFVLSGLFILITLFSLLIPSRVITVSGRDINVPKDQIYAAIKDFQQWKKWHPLFKTGSEINVSGNSSGLAKSLSWGDKKKNTLTITNYFPDGISMQLSRPGENPVENTLRIIPQNDTLTYQVEWRAVTHLKWYPWEKFSGIFINQVTGPGYDAALEALKEYLEKQRAISLEN
jgi:hypothetical protein